MTNTEPGTRKPRFRVHPAKRRPLSRRKGRWYFTLVAANGETLFTSETYVDRAGVEKGIRAVRGAVKANPSVEWSDAAD